MNVGDEHSRSPRQVGRSSCRRRLAPGTWRRTFHRGSSHSRCSSRCAESQDAPTGAQPRALRGRLVAIVAEVVARAEADDGLHGAPVEAGGLAGSRSAGGVERAEQRRRAVVQRRARRSLDLRRHLARLASRASRSGGRRRPSRSSGRAAAPSSRRRRGWASAWRRTCRHNTGASASTSCRPACNWLLAHSNAEKHAPPSATDPTRNALQASLARGRVDRRQRAARAGTTVDAIEVIDARAGLGAVVADLPGGDIGAQRRELGAVALQRRLARRHVRHAAARDVQLAQHVHELGQERVEVARGRRGRCWPPQPARTTRTEKTKSNEARIERLE